MSENNGKKQDTLAGFVVLGLLAALTVAEFIVAQGGGSVTLLGVIALIKTGLIMQYFMHLPKALNPDDEGGH